ncbi:fructosamine kinase family protein [Chamaesiphon minutus]|uniref:Fructosamine-3-kinase n=1 Tax=Chamaesiphon minutus (strain ATCC 27169 / PCC 6605) TaxID=1173020 RepID=K9UIF8_CHAP6|nr:fructosamine kinase family protein [Chamaesiphon minutus]AFY93984.1 fructosamine-3-kinase [Chamaesiphon minutus PCC 6605]
MSDRQIWTDIEANITQATGQQFALGDRRSIGGGCINQVYSIANSLVSSSTLDRSDRYFVKLNQANLVEMFAAEARGLIEIAATATIKVPIPICWGTSGDRSYLVLEYLELTNKVNEQSWHELGSNLAKLHRHQINDRAAFGWHTNNTIASTPQINIWQEDWANFFMHHRIGYQLELARCKGGNFAKATTLLNAIPQLLDGHQPKPSLVHGDLWGGNASFTSTGIPIIYDPATYWGDREVDLALTELFGGFPTAFYQGYDRVYPVDSGYSQRKALYNLYHILNHYNLFGGSYHSQAERSIDSILKYL